MSELAVLAFIVIPAAAVALGYVAVRLNERAGASLEHRISQAERAERADRPDEVLRQARG